MSVNNVVVDVKEKAEFKLSKKIFPAQPDIPTSIDYKKPDFVRDHQNFSVNPKET